MCEAIEGICPSLHSIKIPFQDLAHFLQVLSSDLRGSVVDWTASSGPQAPDGSWIHLNGLLSHLKKHPKRLLPWKGKNDQLWFTSGWPKPASLTGWKWDKCTLHGKNSQYHQHFYYDQMQVRKLPLMCKQEADNGYCWKWNQILLPRGKKTHCYCCSATAAFFILKQPAGCKGSRIIAFW